MLDAFDTVGPSRLFIFVNYIYSTNTLALLLVVDRPRSEQAHSAVKYPGGVGYTLALTRSRAISR